MERVVTAAGMRCQETYVIEEVGMDSILLMERAALFAAQEVKKLLAEASCDKDGKGVSDKKKAGILIVCGTGNNGADGLALARILAEEGYRPDVVLVGNREKRSELNRKQEEFLKKIFREDFTIKGLTDTKERQTEYAVIVDAVLGIGANRELTGEIAGAVEYMNSLSGRKLAMDVPTGVNSDTGNVTGTAFAADRTVTFGLKKAGLLLNEGKQYAGKVKWSSCGIHYPHMDARGGALFTMKKEDLYPYLMRNPGGNKSTFGKIGIVAGSETIAGAALLCLQGAYRSGGGYVRLCTHVNNRETVMQAVPETVLDVYDTTDETFKEKMKNLVSFADVICAGPGIGKSSRAQVMLEELLTQSGLSGKTLILDADALNLLAENKNLQEDFWNGNTDRGQNGGDIILTPHLLEFSRLCGLPVSEICKNKIETAGKYAKEKACTLVLKDAQTIVAGKDGSVYINTTGNSGMAVAGSGDVLAGIIAGLCGQIKDPYFSACCGVYIHGMAGDMAEKKLGEHSMLPTDLIENLKKCMKKLGKEAKENGTV